MERADAVVDPAVAAVPGSDSLLSEVTAVRAAVPIDQTEFAAEVMTGAVEIEPKGKGQLESDRVQNPHEPEASCAVKGHGQQKKEHVGYIPREMRTPFSGPLP